VKPRSLFLVLSIATLAACNSNSNNYHESLAIQSAEVETGDQRIRISWNENSSISSYRIYKLPGPDTDLEDADDIVRRVSSPLVLEGLENNQGYYFAIVGQGSLFRIGPPYRLSAMPEPPFEPKSDLNITGIRECYDGASNDMVDCPVEDWPGQDGDFANKGPDKSGFEFTKIASNGATLPDDAPEWSCVRDNTTGLMWEVKSPAPERVTDPLKPTSIAATYPFHIPDERLNNGNPGTIIDNRDGSGVCPLEDCSTWHYVEKMNGKGLCGYNDWRLPTISEWLGLRDFSPRAGSGPGQAVYIDTDYFPARKNYSDFLRIFWTTNVAASTDDGNPEIGEQNLPAAFWQGVGESGLDRAVRPLFTQHVKLVRDTGKTSAMDLIDTPPPKSVGDQICQANILGSNDPDDFLINNDGTVSHDATGLVWMQCLLGQEWMDGECLGEPEPLPVQKALQEAEHFEFAGFDDWRLPNFKELETLTERACREPAIDRNIFPNHPSRGISLSSTPLDWRKNATLEDLFRGHFYGVSHGIGNGILIDSDKEALDEETAKSLMTRLVRQPD